MKRIYTLHLSEGGPLCIAFTNVKAMFCYIRDHLPGYQLKTIGYGDIAYNYSNLCKEVRQWEHGSVLAACEDFGGIKIIINKVISKTGN